MSDPPDCIAFEGKRYRLDRAAALQAGDLEVVRGVLPSCTCPRNIRSPADAARLRAHPVHLADCPRARATRELAAGPLRPGMRVQTVIDLGGQPPPGFLPAPYSVERGHRGTIARLIYCRVEGEPVDVVAAEINPIVHVRFDGYKEVLALSSSCLRPVLDEEPAP